MSKLTRQSRNMSQSKSNSETERSYSRKVVDSNFITTIVEEIKKNVITFLYSQFWLIQCILFYS